MLKTKLCEVIDLPCVTIGSIKRCYQGPFSIIISQRESGSIVFYTIEWESDMEQKGVIYVLKI